MRPLPLTAEDHKAETAQDFFKSPSHLVPKLHSSPPYVDVPREPNAPAPQNENRVFLGGNRIPMTLRQLCQQRCAEPLRPKTPPPHKVNKSPRREACAPGKLTRIRLSAEQMSFPTESTSAPSQSERNTFLSTTRRITTTKGPPFRWFPL